jgi:NAD(P)-dependent dehydrogenase (short-subunit alcohol dehydrogenase family)
MQLAGRAALITGGTRIGSAIATALAARGVDVALSYHHSRDKAEQTAAAVRGLGRQSLAVQADLSQPDACRGLVARAVEAFGRLDILVALASVYERVPYDDLTEADWERNLAVDLRSSFACAHAAAPHMKSAGGGRIVFFSDWVAASRRPRYTGYVPYYVAKAGVIALGEALALELAADGILVNTIAPGPILPAASVTDKENAAVIRATPLGRWGGPEPIVQAVLALLESDFITGETIQVDGGRHLGG